MIQTLNVDGTASPTNGHSPQAGKSVTDSLMDATIDFLSNEKPSNDSDEAVDRAPKAKQRRPARDAQSEPVQEGPGAEDEETGEEEAEPDGGAEPEEEADGEEHDARGSKETPFTVKDLPKDKYIELKVDGEKLIVSLDEMASGYVREQTFTRRINRTKMLADDAQKMVEHARAFPEKVRSELREFLQDPDQIYDFFLASDQREAVLEAVASRFADLRRHFRENPDQRLAFQRKRDKDRLDAERRHYETQRAEEDRTRAQREAHERGMAIFRPGWEAGLRKAGFPEPNQTLYDETMIRLTQRAQRGETITSDDVADVVARVAKLLELPPGGQKKPKPVPPRERPKAPPPKKKSAWDEMPAHQRRKDADYFLRSLRARDFR